MGNLERLAIGASSICGVAGIGVFLNKSLSNETIRSKLQANDFEILNKNDQYGTWEKIFKVYEKVVQEKSNLKFSLVNVTSAKQLTEACEKVFEKKVGESSENNNYYEKAKRWCTVPTVVWKVLEKERQILNTDPKKEEEEANQKEWDKKIQEYEKKDNKNKITGWELSKEEVRPPENKNKKHREEIKTKCKELNEKKSYEEGYEEALKNSRTWCTIEKKLGK